MILVTGGTGLVGSNLLYHLLLQNESVKAIYQKTSDVNAVKKVFGYYTSDFEKLFKKIVWVEAELNDIPNLRFAFKDVIYVYHCAAFVSFNPADYQKMRRINIEGTTNIVNLCISNSIKKLCFVSSVATVEKSNKSTIDEYEPWNNAVYKSGYAITKYGSEMEIWRASQEGVDVIIVNPGVILGSGFWHKGTGNLFTLINKGFNFYTEGVTGFISVKDVVEIMHTLMQSKIRNERFILVADNVSFKYLFFTIADSLHKKRPRIRVTKLLSEILWRLDYLKSKITNTEPLITKANSRSSQSKHYFSSQKIISALNFKFESIEKSIEKIAKEYNY
jgi:nucleoside-diphosphate-sugar epimerase